MQPARRRVTGVVLVEDEPHAGSAQRALRSEDDVIAARSGRSGDFDFHLRRRQPVPPGRYHHAGER
ncbi:MAG: hypothetical protein ACRYHA_24695, partial [Janthinobacterium lividum]